VEALGWFCLLAVILCWAGSIFDWDDVLVFFLIFGAGFVLFGFIIQVLKKLNEG